MFKFQIITAVLLMFTSSAFAANGHDALNNGGFEEHHRNGGVFGGTNNPNSNDNDTIEVATNNKQQVKEVWGAYRINSQTIGVVSPFGHTIYKGKRNMVLPGQKPYKVPGGGGTNGYKLRFEPDNDNFGPLMMQKSDNRVTYAKGKKKTKRGKAEAIGVKLALKHFTKGMSKKKKKKFKRKVTFVFFEFVPNESK